MFCASFTFIFLGWLLLSVQNNKSSTMLIPVTGNDLLKFKNQPSTNITGVYGAFKLTCVIPQLLEFVALAPDGLSKSVQRK